MSQRCHQPQPVLASGNLMEPLTKALDLYKELRWNRYEAWEENGRSHLLQSWVWTGRISNDHDSVRCNCIILHLLSCCILIHIDTIWFQVPMQQLHFHRPPCCTTCPKDSASSPTEVNAAASSRLNQKTCCKLAAVIGAVAQRTAEEAPLTGFQDRKH